MTAWRPTRPSALSLAGAALSLALAAMILAAPTPARAADDEEVPLDSKIFRGILESLGLRRDGEGINYQERAPLVIPPSRALPPPERSDAVIANNPAWPKDPDVQRAKEEKARERNAIRGAGEQIMHDERVMTEKELTPGANARTARTARRNGNPDTSNTATSYGYGEILSSKELGYKGGFFSKMFSGREPDVAKFTGEPPRTSLTEPPPGYQTPSPDQPYGLSGRTTAPKATDYLSEHGRAER